MKKFRRAMALCLALALVVACFAGCGNGGGMEAAGTVNAEMAALLPKMELENKTVTFFTHLSEDQLTNKDNQYGMDYGLDIFRNVYGGELQIDPIVNWGEYINKVGAMYVADQMTDMIQGGYGVFCSFLSQDQIQAVDPYMPGGFKTDLWKGVSSVLDDYEFNGKHFIVPYSAGPHALIYFNPKLFEQNGVDSPLDLWEDDNWTWTEFRRIAKELTMDTDNNGDTDVYGLQVDRGLLEQLIPTTGVQIMDLDKDSKPVWHWDDPLVAETANLWRDMAVTDKSIGGAFASGTAAMSFYSAYNDNTMDAGWKAPFTDIFADGVVDFVPLPRYDSVDEHILTTRDHPGILASKAKNPEGAAAFMASMRLAGSTEYYASQDGWKQRYYDWGWTDEQIDRAFFEFPEIKVFGTTYSAWGGVWPLGFDRVLKGDTFAQIRSESEPKFQKKTDELYELMKNY
ncbi:MAG: extracellular solute-binding protein [Clostridia bacterium]|nr:extracellular solute-binding protein [Clostridia bacterium]